MFINNSIFIYYRIRREPHCCDEGSSRGQKTKGCLCRRGRERGETFSDYVGEGEKEVKHLVIM